MKRDLIDLIIVQKKTIAISADLLKIDPSIAKSVMKKWKKYQKHSKSVKKNQPKSKKITKTEDEDSYESFFNFEPNVQEDGSDYTIESEGGSQRNQSNSNQSETELLVVKPGESCRIEDLIPLIKEINTILRPE